MFAPLLAFATVLLATTAHARTLDLTKPEDVIRAEIRLDCSPDPAKPRLRWMTGQIMSRRQGEPDQHIFDVQALNTSACQIYDDPKRGPGYRSVTREIMFYIDPVTGKVLETWKNPWTGETVDVVHMFNDPVNMPEPKYAYDKAGKPLPPWPGKIVGGMAHLQRANNYFRESPMGGDYQDYVGGKYSVLELRSILIPAADWLDTDKPSPVRGVAVWSRISAWLPWMKMGGREGYTALTSTWFAVGDISEVSEPLRSEVLSKYPVFATAPPLDDPRPSVSSWDGVKKALNEKRARAK
ncbi:MAG: DUF1838 domain-containing protein [Rhodospirillaceae bacterium]|nr:DUF1838 domain-containing protein [Rhodospirillaceae bacterium]